MTFPSHPRKTNKKPFVGTKWGWEMNTDVTDLSAPQNSPVWAGQKKGLEPQLHVITFGKYILYEEKGKV